MNQLIQQDLRGKSKSKDSENSQRKIENKSNELFSHMNQDNLKYIQNQIKQKNKKNQLSIRKKSQQQTMQPSISKSYPQRIQQKQSKFQQTQRSKQIEKQITNANHENQPSSPYVHKKQIKITKTDGQSQVEQYKQHQQFNRSDLYGGRAPENKLSQQASGGAQNKISYYDMISQARSKRMPSIQAQQPGFGSKNININSNSVSKQSNNFINFLSTYIEDLNSNKKKKNKASTKNISAGGNSARNKKKQKKSNTATSNSKNKAGNRNNKMGKNISLQNNSRTDQLYEGENQQQDIEPEIESRLQIQNQNQIGSGEASGSAYVQVYLEPSLESASARGSEKTQTINVLKNIIVKQQRKSMCLAKQIQQRRKQQQNNKTRLIKLQQCLFKLAHQFETFKKQIKQDKKQKQNAQYRQQFIENNMHNQKLSHNIGDQNYNNSFSRNPNNFTLNQFKLETHPNLNGSNVNGGNGGQKFSHRKNLTTFSMLSNSLPLNDKNTNLYMNTSFHDKNKLAPNHLDMPSISIHKYPYPNGQVETVNTNYLPLHFQNLGSSNSNSNSNSKDISIGIGIPNSNNNSTSLNNRYGSIKNKNDYNSRKSYSQALNDTDPQVELIRGLEREYEKFITTGELEIHGQNPVTNTFGVSQQYQFIPKHNQLGQQFKYRQYD